MLIIELRFPAGRFHATPWGRHVNEGVPEWPPSPYRLVRALYDAWKRKRPEWPESRVEPILAALASEFPQFRLPPGNASHTRSYLSANSKDPTDRNMVFDAFVSVSPLDAVQIGWPTVEVKGPQRGDLNELLSLLNYLGRSESWVSARVFEEQGTGEWNCIPARTGLQGNEFEPTPVACPESREAYLVSPLLVPKFGGRRGEKEPLLWMNALAWGSEERLTAKRNVPPAFVQVSYLRPRNCFEVARQTRSRTRGTELHGVLYAFESKVLPSVTQTVMIAERARRKLMGIHKRLMGDLAAVSPKFSGKDEEGRPLKGHCHLYFLPMDKNRDGKLDHMLVVGRNPLDRMERVALDRLTSMWQSDGKPDIVCVPVSWGLFDELAPSATLFRSITPFIPPRHYRKGRGSFEEWLAREVRREMLNHGLPEPSRVEILPKLEWKGGSRRWIEFRRSRKGDRESLGYGFEVEFPKPAAGFFAIGYGAHFGLGQFAAIE